MPAQEGQSVSTASQLQRTIHKRDSGSEATLRPSTNDRKEDPVGFARAGSSASTSKSSQAVHRLRDHRSFETRPSKSLNLVQASMLATIPPRAARGERFGTTPDRSSPTRQPTFTPQYSAPGSTKQLAMFCEEERARFWSAKSAKKREEPLKWTAQPVPQRLVGLSLVFAVVFSLLSRLWSSLALSCRKRTGPGKLDPVVIPACMIPSAPRTSSLLADSGINDTPTRKYEMRMDQIFTRASSAGPRQSDHSRTRRDAHAPISRTSTLQYPRSREASKQVFTRAVSIEPRLSSNNNEKWRKRNAILDENQRPSTSHTSKKRIDHDVSYRHRSKPLARGRAQSSES